VRVRTLDVHFRWSVRLLCDVSHVRGQRKHLASSSYSMINRESIDEWASSVKTTTLFRLKEISMISPVGSCIVFLPHRRAYLTMSSPTRMSQQMWSAAFQTTRKTSFYMSLHHSLRFTSSRFNQTHQNTNRLALVCKPYLLFSHTDQSGSSCYSEIEPFSSG